METVFVAQRVFLLCQDCRRQGEYEIGTSDEGILPPAARRGGVIPSGTLLNWIDQHHSTLAGVDGHHNSFTVFNLGGLNIGRAGFGTQTGYVFRERPCLIREP